MCNQVRTCKPCGSGNGAEINDETFFRELPAALRTDMALELARPIFSHSDVFECLDEEAERLLAARLTPMVVLAGHNVAQEGDEADALFLLQEGARRRAVKPLHVIV